MIWYGMYCDRHTKLLCDIWYLWYRVPNKEIPWRILPAGVRQEDWLMWASYSVAYLIWMCPNHPGLEGVSSVDHITSIHIQLPSIRIYPLSSDTLSTCSWHEHDPLVWFFLGLRCVFPLSGEQQRLVTTAGQPRIQPSASSVWVGSLSSM